MLESLQTNTLSGLMSLWAFLRVAGNETSGHMAEGPDLGWYCFREMTMGSNLQLIFYKNAADDVIVKILRDRLHLDLIPGKEQGVHMSEEF